MDNLDKPIASKLKGEKVLYPDNITAIDQECSWSGAETPIVAPEISAAEPSKARTKSKKKVFVVALTIVLVLTLICGVVWLVASRNMSGDETVGGATGTIYENYGGEYGEAAAEPGSKDEVVVLSMDDELVQRLYRQFDVTNGQAYLYPDLFMNEYAKSTMAGVAAQNILPEQSDYDAELVKQKVKDIFGVDIVFEDGDKVAVFSPGRSYYEYSAENDKIHFVSVPSGGSGPNTAHGLYKAEKYGGKLFLYDVVANYTPCYYSDSDESKWAAGPFGLSLWLDDWTCNPEMLVDYIDDATGKMSQSDLIKNKDYFTKFKWTFTWNGENYIFEKLERV